MNCHLNLFIFIGGFLKSASGIYVSHVWQQAAVKCVATSAPYIASGGADDTVHIYNAKVQTSCILLRLLVCVCLRILSLAMSHKCAKAC